jgi:hypothetical protein
MPNSVLTGIAGASSPSYSLDDILNFTQQPSSQPSGFRKVLGAVAGGAGNILMPGIGTVIGNAIAGGAPGSTGLLGPEASQMLELQRSMNMETQAFEVATSMLKAQHDTAMDIARNLHS